MSLPLAVEVGTSFEAHMSSNMSTRKKLGEIGNGWKRCIPGTLPKFNMEPKNDGFQVRNLLFQGAIFRWTMSNGEYFPWNTGTQIIYLPFIAFKNYTLEGMVVEIYHVSCQKYPLEIPRYFIHSNTSALNIRIIASSWFQPILKNIGQNGNLPQVGVKILKNENHHLDRIQKEESCKFKKYRLQGLMTPHGLNLRCSKKKSAESTLIVKGLISKSFKIYRKGKQKGKQNQRQPHLGKL